MQLKRAIISFVLILSYSLSFAQSLVPHCSDLNSLEHSHDLERAHQHQHKAQHDDSNENHSHITHNNHFDEGVYDLLICLMSDSEHGASDCCNQQLPSVSRVSIVLFQNDLAKAVSTFIAVFSLSISSEKDDYFDLIETIYRSPQVNALSLRGPPIYS